jgi:hypothetical protein
MSKRVDGLSEGVEHQIDGGLLSDTLGPLSGRTDEAQPPVAEAKVQSAEGSPGDDDGFVGMGPGVDYSSEVREF